MPSINASLGSVGLVSVLFFPLFFFVKALHSEPVEPMQSTTYKIDFGDNACAECGWFVVVDGVMGGLSTARLSATANSIELTGNVSLDNQGGFASIRTPYQTTNLSAYRGVTVRYRSEGQSFGMTLNNHKRFYLPRFKAVLPVTDWAWSTVNITFSEFQKKRFDSVLGGGPSQAELEKIIRLGLISNDKRAGPFKLEVDYIEFTPL